MDMSTRFENHENDGFPGFPKMNPRSYWSKMKQNNSTELSGHSFLKTYNENAPQASPDPKSVTFPGFSIGSQKRVPRAIDSYWPILGGPFWLVQGWEPVFLDNA